MILLTFNSVGQGFFISKFNYNLVGGIGKPTKLLWQKKL